MQPGILRILCVSAAWLLLPHCTEPQPKPTAPRPELAPLHPASKAPQPSEAPAPPKPIRPRGSCIQPPNWTGLQLCRQGKDLYRADRVQAVKGLAKAQTQAEVKARLGLRAVLSPKDQSRKQEIEIVESFSCGNRTYALARLAKAKTKAPPCPEKKRFQGHQEFLDCPGWARGVSWQQAGLRYAVGFVEQMAESDLALKTARRRARGALSRLRLPPPKKGHKLSIQEQSVQCDGRLFVRLKAEEVAVN